VTIIDSILAASDLNTITSKRIREGLQKAVSYDITPQKVDSVAANQCPAPMLTDVPQDAIKALIMTRFDKFVAEQDKAPKANGHLKSPPADRPPTPATKPSSPAAKVAKKRKSDSEDEDRLCDVPVTPQPKKKRKAERLDDDAAFAAKLQAEENSRARPTRGGSGRKNAMVKKKKAPKKKTSDKVKAEDDSELEGFGSGEEKKVNRTGGFHVSMRRTRPTDL
jgi:upstream activation factor subunit UAF30